MSRTRQLMASLRDGVRFTLVDAKAGDRIPAWVVRQHGYVYGLSDWFKRQKLFPGSLITIRRGRQPGEVLIEAKTHKPTREWVRTVLTGSDGGLVFAVLKQDVGCDYNERMVAIVTDTDPVDLAWEQWFKNRQPFEKSLAMMIRELSKLTPQGHVHAQELYSAINILRRTPPAPLMATLAVNNSFKHVGDLYFRMNDSESEGLLMAEAKKFSLMKPSVKTPFHIDFDWWQENESDWHVHLSKPISPKRSSKPGRAMS